MDRSVYEIETTPPSELEFIRLRHVGGLTSYPPEAVRRGIDGAVLTVCIRAAGEAVGMGRVISDGGTCYHIIDFVVDPAHQRQGLGREIMRTIMDWLEKNAPAGANINLIADLPADKLYAQFGFRPTAPGSIAMDQWLSVKGDKH